MSAERIFPCQRFAREQLWGISGIKEFTSHPIRKAPFSGNNIPLYSPHILRVIKSRQPDVNNRILIRPQTTADIIFRAIRNASIYYSSFGPVTEGGRTLYSPLDVAYEMKREIIEHKKAESPSEIAELYNIKDKDPIKRFAFGVVFQQVVDADTNIHSFEKRPADLIDSFVSQIFGVARQMHKEELFFRSQILPDLPNEY